MVRECVGCGLEQQIAATAVPVQLEPWTGHELTPQHNTAREVAGGKGGGSGEDC